MYWLIIPAVLALVAVVAVPLKQTTHLRVAEVPRLAVAELDGTPIITDADEMARKARALAYARKFGVSHESLRH